MFESFSYAVAMTPKEIENSSLILIPKQGTIVRPIRNDPGDLGE